MDGAQVNRALIRLEADLRQWCPPWSSKLSKSVRPLFSGSGFHKPIFEDGRSIWPSVPSTLRNEPPIDMDVLRILDDVLGAFSYRGASAFTGGNDNSEARISGNLVLVDMNGDAVVDLSIRLSGFDRATRLSAADFVFE